MLIICIILAVLLAIATTVAVRYSRQLEGWKYFDQEATRVLAVAYATIDKQSTTIDSFLDRNVDLRGRLGTQIAAYDDLFVKYAKQSLSATDITEDTAEILGEPLMVPDDAVDTVEILDTYDLRHRYPAPTGRRIMVNPAYAMKGFDNGDHLENKLCSTFGCTPKPAPFAGFGSRPKPGFVNDMPEEIDPEVPISYYIPFWG